jgi:hypothetical protein
MNSGLTKIEHAESGATGHDAQRGGAGWALGAWPGLRASFSPAGCVRAGKAPVSAARTTLADEWVIASAVTTLEEHGFSVEVVDDLDAARQAVLARILHGSPVMTNTSVTLAETGIADAINDGEPYDSARNKMFALDFATQAQEMKAIGGQPDYALGSVHAVTRDGTLVIARLCRPACRSTAPVDARPARHLGMPLKPAACERAQRHQGQPLACRSVDSRRHQPAADAAAFQLERNLGVDQHQPAPADTVDKLREPPVRAQLEPGRVRVVDNIGRIVHLLRHCSPWPSGL